ncbi:hypothetical protein VTJ49DRAFT_1486 [Mycothermus thermophilus]|uniref:UBC core domain-containing protein n=1 Tax=Humicola insolens TaxID=85995 RepID=A0ABR3VD80_HUMIN
MAASRAAARRLMQEQALLRKEKWINFEDDEDTNLFCWKFGLMVINADSAFSGGYFRAEMEFKPDYPHQPPTFKFLTPITHPNVYTDGRVCISILHPPGEDEMSGDSAAERWTSIQGAESVLRSILLLLDDPEPSSPANVDAGRLFRFRPRAYLEEARRAVERSLRDLPEGFTIPESFEDEPPTAAAAAATTSTTCTSPAADAQGPVSSLLAEAQALLAAQVPAAAAAAQVHVRHGAHGRVLRGIRPEDPYETDGELPGEYYSDDWVQNPDRGFWEDNEGADQEPDDDDDEESESELEDESEDDDKPVVAAGFEVDPDEEAALWEYLGFEVPECTRVVGVPW